MATWEMRQTRRAPKVPLMATYPHDATGDQRTPSMRILVAFEDLRSLYRDVFVSAIRALRPALTVRSASLDELDRMLRHFDPHVVVCSQPSGVYPACSGAWVQIPTDDEPEDGEWLAQLGYDDGVRIPKPR